MENGGIYIRIILTEISLEDLGLFLLRKITVLAICLQYIPYKRT